MFTTTLVNIDATLEAHLCQLLIRIGVKVLKVKLHVLASQPPKVHVELTRNERLRHQANDWRIYRNLLLEKSEYIVYRVETSDGLNAHKVGHMNQRLGLKLIELAKLRKQLSVLEQVSRQKRVLTKHVLQLFNEGSRFFGHIWIGSHLCEVVGEDINKFLSSILLPFLQLDKLLLTLFAAYKL